MDAVNPRTGEVDYSFEPDNVAEAAARLRRRAADWSALTHSARAAALGAWADRLESARDEVIAVLLADTGRLSESVMEFDAVLSGLRRWASTPETNAERRVSALPLVTIEPGLKPYELVGVISPWNFPLLLSMIDAVPALLAGCAVLVKPSEVTPRFVDNVAPTIGDLPIAFVRGDGATGTQVIDSVDCVCFTGSVPTGLKVAAQSAARFIPAFLELGGKDPAVVLDGADVSRAASAILWGSTANCGQSCQSIERVYVHQSIYDQFVETLVSKASALRLAKPGPGDGEIGPVIAPRQAAVIADQLEDALAKGAQALTGGKVITDGGSWIEPTVLIDVDHTMKVMREETFGPVIPIMKFEDTTEAVRLANDTEYGLSAAVFGPENDAVAVARQLDAGAVSINDAALTAIVHDAEKQSFGKSGMGGSRMGAASIRRFSRAQALLITNPAVGDPWWYRSTGDDLS